MLSYVFYMSSTAKKCAKTQIKTHVALHTQDLWPNAVGHPDIFGILYLICYVLGCTKQHKCWNAAPGVNTKMALCLLTCGFLAASLTNPLLSRPPALSPSDPRSLSSAPPLLSEPLSKHGVWEFCKATNEILTQNVSPAGIYTHLWSE